MTIPGKSKLSAYDKYVNYKRFSIAVAAFILPLLLPIPGSMRDVAVEYAVGREVVLDFYTRQLFGVGYADAAQWQSLTARALESCMRQGALSKEAILRRKTSRLAAAAGEAPPEHWRQFRETVEGMTPVACRDLMERAYRLRYDELSYAGLTQDQQRIVDQRAHQIRVCIGLVAFVVICFATEAIPLPGVAFCIGLILVFAGIVGREEVASLFWSDACWFIMGSLMFAAAFVKTGVDKRIRLIIFRSLAKPSVGWVTAVLILVISPAAAFISDHALAAIFLPIAIILYNNSLTRDHPGDPELGKLLMITIAMACNIGGFGSPSGGARNVIMMSYMEDMFGISMGYGQWMIYAMPFVIIMMPILWLLLRWRFKPLIQDLRPAMESLKDDIGHMGGWNRQQIGALIIFLVMLFGWITEKNLLQQLLGIRLGIGVIAMAGAVAYLLTGIVNWRVYQEKVDWGVVWLYAGAIIFGRILDETGTAFWMARSIVTGLASIGMSSGLSLLGAGGLVTAGLTNLMADGPAAAAVGPITLNMAAVANPGTTLVPFMGLATACASSFAYLLVIGTPPNAIVYASGYLEAKDFLRIGVVCFVVAFAVLLGLSLLYWPLLGYTGLSSF
jgi:sodium-dependent dicarboxylate transporter 2/3/5